MNHVYVRWPLVALLTLVVVAGGVYAWYVMTPTKSLEPTPSLLTRVTGTAVVTGISPEAPNGAVYELTLSTGTLRKIYDGQFFAPSRSVDGKIAVITKREDGQFGLVVMKDKNGTDAVHIESPVQGLYPGVSVWSHDGRYLTYEMRPASDIASDAKTGDARIVLLDTITGEQVVVAQGSSPAFMPDGSIVYAGAFGVYRVSRTGMALEEPQGVVGWRTEDALAAFSTSIALSKDGTTLAIADPELDELRIYALDTTSAPVNERVVPAIAVAPAFTPDGIWLAYTTYTSGEQGQQRASVLLNTETMEAVVSANLTKFDDYMFSFGIWN